jgi:hypothetical protein
VASTAELVAIHAEDRPATVAVKVIRGERLTFAGLHRRSNRLAHGLATLGVTSDDRVALLCCDAHAPDLLVAYLAAQKLAAVAVVVSPTTAPRELRALLGDAAARLVLACPEGVSAARRAGASGVIVGDGEGVTWWKALELRQPATPIWRARRPFDIADVVGGDASTQVEVRERARVPVPLENGGVLHAVPLSTSVGLHSIGLAALAAGVPQVVQTPFQPEVFSRLLAHVPVACLLPAQVSELPAGSDWTATWPGLCWHHPMAVDIDAEGGFGVGLGLAAAEALSA